MICVQKKRESSFILLLRWYELKTVNANALKTLEIVIRFKSFMLIDLRRGYVLAKN